MTLSPPLAHLVASRAFACLLTWSAFSSGAVLYNRAAKVRGVLTSPGLPETAASLFAVVLAGVWVATSVHTSGLPVCIAAGLVLGCMSRFVGARSIRWTSAGAGEFARVDELPPKSSLWGWIKRWGLDVADYQARLLINVVYFLVFTPVAVLVRWNSSKRVETDPASNWVTRAPAVETLDAARRQFE